MTLVLIADDSSIFAEMLAEVLAEDHDMTVAGIAGDGARAVTLARALRPDVIVMDVVMPILDGFEAVSQIVAEQPIPVLMMTGDARGRTADLAFEGLRRGAVDLLLKPTGWPFTPDQRRLIRERVRTAARMRPLSGARLMPPPLASPPSTRTPSPLPAKLSTPPPPPPSGRGVAVVGVAASTGGPAALSVLLSALPADFAAGIAIVQHLSPGFVDALARWLALLTPLRVSVARDRDVLRPGTVLIAPDNLHLTVDRDARVRLSATPDHTAHKPAADILFESLASGFGSRAAAVVLTGAGDDGARGVEALRRVGAPTFAQDEASCVAFGMPRAAILSGSIERVLPLDRLASQLRSVVGSTGGPLPALTPR
jgi:two-component system chemotaxis response regulator CheB